MDNFRISQRMDLSTSIHHDMSQLLIPQLFHCAICCHDLHDVIRLFHSNIASTSPMSLTAKCAIISSPGICFGQYLLFFMRAWAKHPLFSIRSSRARHRTLNQGRRSSLFHKQALTNEEVSQLWIPAHQTPSSQDGPDNLCPLRDLLAR